MNIKNAECAFVREKLKAPFGFKGGYLSELWQVAVKITGEKEHGIGVGVQSVLWSDAEIFSSRSEEDGNALMYSLSQKASRLIVGKSDKTPIEIIDKIYSSLSEYAREKAGRAPRETFIRNSLVAVDNALWTLYGKESGSRDLMNIIPTKYRAALSEKHEKLCNIPLISYGVSENEIERLLKNGFALLKIKIGNDGGGKISKEEMLEWDKARFKQISDMAKGYETPYTRSGKVLFYLDANGRYDTKERISDFLFYAEEIGALDRIVLLEEPFEENNKINVKDLPVRVAADESVHSVSDVEERIALGYGAVALKPIAKTLSETLKILKKASEKEVPCFCADLTVNPLMTEFNKNIAARIKTLPEMKIGILESNGEQNYANWEKMKSYSPSFGKPYAEQKKGIFELNEEFYATSGSIFDFSEYYESLFDGNGKERL